MRKAWAGDDQLTRNDTLNQAKNRRVEIKIYPAEAGGLQVGKAER